MIPELQLSVSQTSRTRRRKNVVGGHFGWCVCARDRDRMYSDIAKIGLPTRYAVGTFQFKQIMYRYILSNWIWFIHSFSYGLRAVHFIEIAFSWANNPIFQLSTHIHFLFKHVDFLLEISVTPTTIAALE